MKAYIYVAAIELVALIVGLGLWYFGVIAGKYVALFLFGPPILAGFVLMTAFLVLANEGGNPFQ